VVRAADRAEATQAAGAEATQAAGAEATQAAGAEATRVVGVVVIHAADLAITHAEIRVAVILDHHATIHAVAILDLHVITLGLRVQAAPIHAVTIHVMTVSFLTETGAKNGTDIMKSVASEQSATSLWRFDGTSGPLAFHRADAVQLGLQRCVMSWPAYLTDDYTDPLGGAKGNGCGGYAVSSRFTERQAEGLSVTAAVCSLIADLTLDWSETAEDVTGLHAAAICTDAGIVIITGPARAGKSTLVSRLALEPGITFVCDDVLPLRRNGQGVALGVAPRLRLPLPNPHGPLQRAMQRELLLADNYYAYFSPPNRMEYGTEAPIAAIILIERAEGEAPALWKLSEEDALAALLRQSITSFGTADQAFCWAESLLPMLPRARFVYSDLEEAAAYLHTALKHLNSEALPTRARTNVAETASNHANGSELPDPNILFEQNPLVVSRVIGSRQWLTLPEDGTLWEINPTSRALWAMLEIPSNTQDLTEVLTELYPDTSEEEILRDVQQTLGDFVEANLIQPVALPSCLFQREKGRMTWSSGRHFACIAMP